MIILRTGKPGHGKTLNAIREIDEKAFRAGRVVYYHNVTGLKPEKLQASWFEFEDVSKWYELPADAIIVVDEAQGSAARPMFGVRDPRKPIPEHVSRLELIRKNGHELHLITQDPRFLDVHVRRLADGHIHFVRVFKSAQLLRFESPTVIEEVEKKTAFKDADKQPVKIDRRFFDVYQSANASHHFKVKVPKKFLLASLVIVVAGVLVYRAVGRYQEGAQQDQAAPAGEKSLVDRVSDKVDSVLSPEATAAPKTKAQYLAYREPRIPDIPSSAPMYDDLTKPVSYPRMYCLSTSDPFLVAKRPPDTVKDGVSCQCYSQQATRVATSFDFCVNAATYGFFDASLPDRQSLDAYKANPLPSVSTATPEPSFGPDAPPKQVRVTQVPYVKGEFLW